MKTPALSAFKRPSTIKFHGRLTKPYCLRLLLAMSLLGLVFFFAGCVQQSAEKTADGSQSRTSEGDLPEKQAALIAQLLYEGEVALKRNRLTTPEYDNAYDRYRQVLRLDPYNEPASLGVKRIGRRYLKLAQKANKDGDWEKAMRYVKIAAQVDPNYPAIRHMQSYLESLSQAQKNVIYLNMDDLKLRNVKIKTVLEGLAKKAKELNSRILIVAPSDALGRWIYQQMRSAVAGHRLRGNIEYAQQAKVVLMDLQL